MEIDILLATYKPNKVFFPKLLKSLDSQTFNNVRLIVRDDSSDWKCFLEIQNDLNKYMKNIPFLLKRNNENMGSNKTFELLTQEAKGEYLAYCDQDDIWHENKLEELLNLMQLEKADLAYSDLTVIDEEDSRISSSFKKYNKRLKPREGSNLFNYFITQNCVTGCAMLVKKEVAQKALPFSNNYYVHDHWIALVASTESKIVYSKKKLVDYRIHSDNQVGGKFFHTIFSEEDYYEKKLIQELEKYNYLLSNYKFDNQERKYIENVISATKNRVKFFNSPTLKNLFLVLLDLKKDPQKISFEIILKLIPSKGKAKLIAYLK